MAGQRAILNRRTVRSGSLDLIGEAQHAALFNLCMVSIPIYVLEEAYQWLSVTSHICCNLPSPENIPPAKELFYWSISLIHSPDPNGDEDDFLSPSIYIQKSVSSMTFITTSTPSRWLPMTIPATTREILHWMETWRCYHLFPLSGLSSLPCTPITINIALPQISSDFRSLDDVTWYASGYLPIVTAIQAVCGCFYRCGAWGPNSTFWLPQVSVWEHKPVTKVPFRIYRRC